MGIALTSIPGTRPDDEEHGAELDGRQRILLAAARLFLTRGYAETSVRVIADAVEMKPASIYHHFSSKDELLTEILDIGMDAVTTAFASAHAELDNNADAKTRLEAHVAAHLHALFGHQAFTAAHVTVFPFVPATVRSAAVSQRDAYEASWTELLHSIAPKLDDTQIRLVRLTLFGAMNSTIQWFDTSEGSLDGLARTIVHTLWVGLGELGSES